VPGMAGEVDARVQLHHLLHGILGHSGEILNHYFDLSNQINLGHSSFGRREN
jgi:protein-arginine kinase